jgi:hypothetical protein
MVSGLHFLFFVTLGGQPVFFTDFHFLILAHNGRLPHKAGQVVKKTYPQSGR